jgi:hypothetical protein
MTPVPKKGGPVFAAKPTRNPRNAQTLNQKLRHLL